MRIKVCCIQSLAEAEEARRLGADVLGVVSRMPSGPGPIPEARIRAILQAQPAHTETWLLTCEVTAEALAAQQRRTGAQTLQLCDHVDPAEMEALRGALPHTRLVRVVHVTGPESLADAESAAALADALLLDSGRTDLKRKELGGTGRTHDWELSRAIRQRARIPVWLAGGLTPANVAEAIEAVRPHGVDVCSGVRTDGRLNEDLLRRFVEAAGGATSR